MYSRYDRNTSVSDIYAPFLNHYHGDQDSFLLREDLYDCEAFPLLQSSPCPSRTRTDCARGAHISSPGTVRQNRDPFSEAYIIPVIVDYDTPKYASKRNERERERVRCVNDSYARLRELLPYLRKDKRVSKVEIIRMAIKYIKHLRQLLEDDDDNIASIDNGMTFYRPKTMRFCINDSE